MLDTPRSEVVCEYGYPLHSPVSPSLPLPVRHRVPSSFKRTLLQWQSPPTQYDIQKLTPVAARHEIVRKVPRCVALVYAYMSTKSECEGSNAIREMVSGEMPFKCRLWRSRGLHTTANLWKVFGQRNSVCLWNTCCFVAQLTRDVITNYQSTYVPSTTSRHISTASSFPTSLLSKRGRGFIDEWLIYPLVLTKVTRLLHTFPAVRLINSYRRRPSPWQIMWVAQIWCTKIGAMAVRRLLVDVRMPKLPVRQTLKLLITACRDTWRGWSTRRNRRLKVNS